MPEMRIGDQTIRYDREATVAVYGTINHGDAEECGCIFCQNFAIQRNLAYPASFRALLEQVGIDPAKEGEVFKYGPAQNGHYSYGGWFYLVGEMVAAGEKNTRSAGSHHFEFWFTSQCPDAPAFRGGPLLAVEFTTHVDWVLPEKPE